MLDDAFDEVVEERVCYLFTILGTAGVGKSRLVREFVAGIHPQHEALVLRGRCLSYGEGITYWPISEIVRQAAGLSDNLDESICRNRLGELIDDERDRAHAVERLGELVGLFSGSASKDETFWAVRTMLRSLAGRRPVIVIIDDLHWAEPTLLDLVDHLAEWLTDVPVMLLCLARRELLDVRAGWGGGKAHAATVTLEPLNAEESSELVVALLGQVELGEQLATRISTAAEGNPLFVEEMLAMLIDANQLRQVDGAWEIDREVSAVTVPATIQALLSARIDGLGDRERLVLERASVEGKVFHHAAVAALVPADARAEVSGQLLALTRKELVRPEPAQAGNDADELFRFRHLLIRDAAYEAMPKGLRAELHAAFAEWMVTRTPEHFPEFDELSGYHYERAYRYRTELGLADRQTAELGRLAARHLGEAGRRALDRGDIAAARKLLTAATEVVEEEDPDRTGLASDLAMTMRMAGDIDGALAVAQQAVRAARPGDENAPAYPKLVVAALENMLGRRSVAEFIERCRSLLEELRQQGDERGVERALIELAAALFFSGHARQAELVLTEHLANSSAEGHERNAEMDDWLSVFLVWGPAPVAEATERATRLLDTAPNRTTEGYAAANLGLLRAFAGEFDEGRELLRRAETIMRDMGRTVMVEAEAGSMITELELIAENPIEALRRGRQAFDELMSAGERGFAATMAGTVSVIHVRLGNLDEAENYAMLASELTQPDDRDAQVRSLRTRARVLAKRGQMAEALQLAQAAVDTIEATDYLVLRGDTFADVAEVHLAAGDRPTARLFLERARDEYTAKGITVAVGRIDRRLAQLAGD